MPGYRSNLGNQLAHHLCHPSTTYQGINTSTCDMVGTTNHGTESTDLQNPYL